MVHYKQISQSKKKKKCGKYSVEYLKYGFIKSPCNKTLPMCLICNKVLSNEAKKPSRLAEYFRKIKPEKKDKKLSFSNALINYRNTIMMGYVPRTIFRYSLHRVSFSIFFGPGRVFFFAIRVELGLD